MIHCTTKHQNKTKKKSLEDTGASEDEGQHLQGVYKKARQIGGARRWFYHDEAHMTEHDIQDAESERLSLLRSWAPYWNLTSSVLVEKSPRHTAMTRYLQGIFGKDTIFFVTIRHPFGSMYHFYHRFNEEKAQRYYEDCAELDIKGFLGIYDWLVQDLPYLNHVGVVSLEALLDPQNIRAVVHEAEHMLGLSPSIAISTSDDSDLDEDDPYHLEASKFDVFPLEPEPISAPTTLPDVMQPGLFDYKTRRRPSNKIRKQHEQLQRADDGGGGGGGDDDDDDDRDDDDNVKGEGRCEG